MGKANQNNECNYLRLQRLVENMRCSPMGADIIDWLDRENINIEFDNSLPKTQAGNTSEPYDHLVLNPKMDDLGLLFTIAHETRHLWQARQFSECEGLEELQLNSYFLMNPWAKCVFTRFIEADAFSFQYTFMLDYIAAYFAADNFPFETLNVDFDEVTYMTLEKLDFDLASLKTDKPDLQLHRKTAFEAFFNSGTMQDYDFSAVNFGSAKGREYLRNALSEVFNSKAGPEPIGEDEEFLKDHLNILKEKHLTLLGGSTVGELDDTNYLLDKNGKFTMKKLYTDVSDDKIRSILSEFNDVAVSRNLNSLTRTTGKKQKLISL